MNPPCHSIFRHGDGTLMLRGVFIKRSLGSPWLASISSSNIILSSRRLPAHVPLPAHLPRSFCATDNDAGTAVGLEAERDNNAGAAVGLAAERDDNAGADAWTR